MRQHARPTILKTLVAARVDNKLVERMDAYSNAMEYPPSRGAMIEVALKEYLDKKDKPRK